MRLSLRVFIAIIGLLIVLGTLGTIKGLQIKSMVAYSENFVPPPQTVTVAEVTSTAWETSIRAVGSLKAVQGVMVSAELPGKVMRIAFEPGIRVKAGQLLVQQDISAETAELKSAESEAALARKNLKRSQDLVEQKVVPTANLDDNQARYEQAAARVDLIRAAIDKKTIKAPFSGKLGIRQVNLGEYLDSGQHIVSLQSLNPIFVNFQLPQREFARLSTGLKVRVIADALHDETIEGKITAVNPEVNRQTRNIEVQATISNPDERLRPGMYATVEVVLPAQDTVLTIPATSVRYAPYSDSVFLVEPGGEDKDPKQMVLRQQFVRLGDKRGDFVVVRDGLDEGQQVVTTGVFKLRNGQPVVIDNQLAPEFETAPRPADA